VEETGRTLNPRDSIFGIRDLGLIRATKQISESLVIRDSVSGSKNCNVRVLRFGFLEPIPWVIGS
jgi:hypothetical protein